MMKTIKKTENDSNEFKINGWLLLSHPLFTNQLEDLYFQVSDLKKKYPTTFKQKNATKILAAIFKLTCEKIPENPNLSEYRLGVTLGDEYKHWFRAKFFHQYRLFFRFHTESKIIVYAWVNDENTKRVYGSNTDAYYTFKKMLRSNSPPNNWDDLIKESCAFSKLYVLNEKTEDYISVFY